MTQRDQCRGEQLSYSRFPERRGRARRRPAVPHRAAWEAAGSVGRRTEDEEVGTAFTGAFTVASAGRDR